MDTGAAVDAARGVLVIDQVNGRSRSAVAAVRALAAGGYRPLVAVSGRPAAAAVSRFCAGVVELPDPASPGYRKAVEGELKSGQLTLLAASDAALVALQQPGAELVDKAALPARVASAGLAMPTTRVFAHAAQLCDVAADLDYPLVVKSAVKSSAEAVARRINGPADMRAVSQDLHGPVVVQPFLRGRLRAVCGVVHDGVLLAAVHQSYLRIWPPDCGVASAAVTVAPDVELEPRLLRLLAGHCGVFQVQLLGDHVIDINPRVYGSLPLAVAAGTNLPAVACQARAGRRGELVRARPGVRYRWLEGDLRRIVHDVRHRRLGWRAAAGAMRPRSGTAHSVESVRDPQPGLYRLRDIARRRL